MALSNSAPTFDTPPTGGETVDIDETATGDVYEVRTTHPGGPVVITIFSQTPSTPVFTIAMIAAKKGGFIEPRWS